MCEKLKALIQEYQSSSSSYLAHQSASNILHIIGCLESANQNHLLIENEELEQDSSPNTWEYKAQEAEPFTVTQNDTREYPIELEESMTVFGPTSQNSHCFELQKPIRSERNYNELHKDKKHRPPEMTKPQPEEVLTNGDAMNKIDLGNQVRPALVK
jgi:hypothetical protein